MPASLNTDAGIRSMEVEQIEIRRHLEQHPPFDALPESRLDKVAVSVGIAYYQAGATILSAGEAVQDLHYIRSGGVEITRRDGRIHNRLGEGELFGQLALITGQPARFTVRALEDTLVYFIPESVFRELFEGEEDFAEFVEIEDRTRLRQAAAATSESAGELMTARVSRLVRADPISVVETASIRESAHAMAAREVSAIVIRADGRADGAEAGDIEAANGDMVGIVTSDDLVERALAVGMDPGEPISRVMTTDPIHVNADDLLFEALLVMLRHNIHYLPVMDRNRLVGLVDLADVVSLETQNSLFVVRNIFLQGSVEELKALLPDIRACFLRMVRDDANSRMIGSAISAIGRSLKQRLLELGHERFGSPPVPYCFLALGSMARDEQIMYSDQDNALVLDDAYDPDRHGDYFEALSTFVCDGLAGLGYRYCKGGFMAGNERWRKPLQAWKSEFAGWIENPRAQALLHGSVFFDLDGVAGETRMADELRTFVAEKASQSPRFLGCLARNAQNRTPPLGFFKDFVLESSGRYQRTLNLKRRGTAPLVDVVRVHALAAGSDAQNSFRRLEDIVAAGFLTSGMAADLRDALEFISIVRVRHQAADLEAGRDPNNNLDPEALSGLERRSLKDSFQVLSNAQKFIKFRYRA